MRCARNRVLMARQIGLIPNRMQLCPPRIAAMMMTRVDTIRSMPLLRCQCDVPMPRSVWYVFFMLTTASLPIAMNTAATPATAAAIDSQMKELHTLTLERTNTNTIAEAHLARSPCECIYFYSVPCQMCFGVVRTHSCRFAFFSNTFHNHNRARSTHRNATL